MMLLSHIQKLHLLGEEAHMGVSGDHVGVKNYFDLVSELFRRSTLENTISLRHVDNFG